ncbi:MAG: 1-acyl-sn-glycerol-3-phosphate acyltransferase [Clostridiaceae bacterium]|nr:1-acyl-sn-glycerol-3-phosphate acyltransferase [Clostridiaceae bacterium]
MRDADRLKSELAGNDKFAAWIRGTVRVLAALFLWPVYLPRRQGQLMEPEGEGCILIANHHSILDPIFVTFLYPSPRLSIVAKQELYRMKLIGRILKAFRSIPLDRSIADVRASKLILSQIKAGRVVGIFPEGTRVKPQEAATAQLHASILIYAIRRGIPLLPVSIQPRYGFLGRPRYIFSQPVRYGLNKSGAPSKEEQEAMARELMRRIYQGAGLDYNHPKEEEYRKIFEELVTETPVQNLVPVGRKGKKRGD